MSQETALHDAFMGYADGVGDRLVVLHGALLEGTLTPDDFIDRASVLVGDAQARMYALADASLSAWLTVETGTAVPSLGIGAPNELPRLREGLSTLLAVVDPEAPALRVARFGRSETAGAFQDGYSAAMGERPQVGGWRRVLNSTACELCRWLYRDGYVYRPRQSFHRHAGCGCHPEPVLK